jgi:hypothetical protein
MEEIALLEAVVQFEEKHRKRVVEQSTRIGRRSFECSQDQGDREAGREIEPGRPGHSGSSMDQGRFQDVRWLARTSERRHRLV